MRPRRGGVDRPSHDLDAQTDDHRRHRVCFGAASGRRLRPGGAEGGAAARIRRSVHRPSPPDGDESGLRPDPRPLAPRPARLESLRAAALRRAVQARTLVGSVQPEHPERRLPDLRAERLHEPLGHLGHAVRGAPDPHRQRGQLGASRQRRQLRQPRAVFPQPEFHPVAQHLQGRHGLQAARLGVPRHQHIGILNYFYQDFLVPGYTLQFSAHYLHDSGGSHTDENGFVTRPAVTGIVFTEANPQVHTLDTVYLGWTGDGHIGPLNVNHAYYHVLGRDTFNNLAGRPLDINADMAALELSMDFDWFRPKATFFWASGDGKPLDGRGRGFDSILDNPNFAGGGVSYYLRPGIPLPP